MWEITVDAVSVIITFAKLYIFTQPLLVWLYVFYISVGPCVTLPVDEMMKYAKSGRFI